MPALNEHHRVYILGSGPAGLTAAIYCARAGLDPVLATGLQRGGQLTQTSEIENFPGFPEGLQGAELMERMEQQALRFGLRLHETAVLKVDLSRRPFAITEGDQSIQTCDCLIVATGASPKKLGVPGERAFAGRGVSYCATCDGFFFRNKEIAVIGGGDAALEEAQYLSRIASKVTLCHRRDRFRASKALQQKVLSNAKIEIAWNSVVTEILGGPRGVTGLRLQNQQDGSLRELPCSGCFCAIGHEPQSELFRGQLELDAGGYILTRAPSTETSVPGVFACGDVADPLYRQAIAAAGRGCAAALDAERWLESQTC